MMLERLRTGETIQKASDTFYRTLTALKLAEVEEVKIPEPYFAVIDGKPYLFSYDDTHVARCVENPLLSAIVYEPKDEQGEVTGGACIYGQDQLMEDLAAQGYRVDDEGLAEAQANYHVFHPRGNEQAQLN